MCFKKTKFIIALYSFLPQPNPHAYMKFIHIKAFTTSNLYVKVLFSQNSLAILSFLFYIFATWLTNETLKETLCWKVLKRKVLCVVIKQFIYNFYQYGMSIIRTPQICKKSGNEKFFSRKRRVWLEVGLFRKGEGLWFDIKFLFKKIKNIKMLHNFLKFSKSFFET